MTPKDPFLEGNFWDKFWRPIRSRALLFTPDRKVIISNMTVNISSRARGPVAGSESLESRVSVACGGRAY